MLLQFRMRSVLPTACIHGLVEGIGEWYSSRLSTAGERGCRVQEGECMAHAAHLALHKQGVEAWHQWREDHPRRRSHLSDADLPWQALDDICLWCIVVPEGVFQMPTVRVVLKDGEEKIYHNAEAHIDTHNLLRIHRAENSIAEFQAEHYRYWEYVEREEESNE
jgi:hypothetical protein